MLRNISREVYKFDNGNIVEDRGFLNLKYVSGTMDMDEERRIEWIPYIRTVYFPDGKTSTSYVSKLFVYMEDDESRYSIMLPFAYDDSLRFSNLLIDYLASDRFVNSIFEPMGGTDLLHYHIKDEYATTYIYSSSYNGRTLKVVPRTAAALPAYIFYTDKGRFTLTQSQCISLGTHIRLTIANLPIMAQMVEQQDQINTLMNELQILKNQVAYNKLLATENNSELLEDEMNYDRHVSREEAEENVVLERIDDHAEIPENEDNDKLEEKEIVVHEISLEEEDNKEKTDNNEKQEFLPEENDDNEKKEETEEREEKDKSVEPSSDLSSSKKIIKLNTNSDIEETVNNITDTHPDDNNSESDLTVEEYMEMAKKSNMFDFNLIEEGVDPKQAMKQELEMHPELRSALKSMFNIKENQTSLSLNSDIIKEEDDEESIQQQNNEMGVEEQTMDNQDTMVNVEEDLMEGPSRDEIIALAIDRILSKHQNSKLKQPPFLELVIKLFNLGKKFSINNEYNIISDKEKRTDKFDKELYTALKEEYKWAVLQKDSYKNTNYVPAFLDIMRSGKYSQVTNKKVDAAFDALTWAKSTVFETNSSPLPYMDSRLNMLLFMATQLKYYNTDNKDLFPKEMDEEFKYQEVGELFDNIDVKTSRTFLEMLSDIEVGYDWEDGKFNFFHLNQDFDVKRPKYITFSQQSGRYLVMPHTYLTLIMDIIGSAYYEDFINNTNKLKGENADLFKWLMKLSYKMNLTYKDRVQAIEQLLMRWTDTLHNLYQQEMKAKQKGNEKKFKRISDFLHKFFNLMFFVAFPRKQDGSLIFESYPEMKRTTFESFIGTKPLLLALKLIELRVLDIPKLGDDDFIELIYTNVVELVSTYHKAVIVGFLNYDEFKTDNDLKEHLEGNQLAQKLGLNSQDYKEELRQVNGRRL